MNRWGAIVLFIISPVFVQAQTSDNRVTAWMINGNAYVADSLIIDPTTLKVLDNTDSEVSIAFDPASRTISLQGNPSHIPDSIKIQYRIIRMPVSTFASRTMHEYDSAAPFKDYRLFTTPINQERQRLFETGTVATTGRLSRGITVGNTRDLLVNSSLNLTLDGKLSEDLFIRASITDQNIPYQPEGNTAQLQDFDNVFMQLYNNDFDITAGDIVLNNGPTKFLRYYKNVQGAQFRTKGEKSSIQLGASLAKGKFASVKIEPIDGLSGPYRVPGPNGEAFVVVLANSEKVFLDGKELSRGFNNDYVIDYNLGELTFTSRIMITRYSRIRIDYEFADTRYDRSILTAGYEQKLDRGRIYINAYSEKDNKSRPNFDLTDEDMVQLSLAGDEPLLAITSGADSVGFDPDRILYKKVRIDSEEVYVYSTDPDSAAYEVKFSRVGDNLGNYVQKTNTANGRVYEWIPRLNGEPQGNYEPHQVIPMASKKQMVAIGGNFDLNNFESVSFETSVSQQDKNLFSNLDNDDNAGSALSLGIHSKERRIKGSEYKFHGGITFEHLDQHFSAIDRFRSIEFDRDWTYDPSKSMENANDDMIGLNLGLGKDRFNEIDYTMSRRIKEDMVDGFQQNLKVRKEVGNFRLISDLFTLDNEQKDLTSEWMRLRTDISYSIGDVRPGYVFSRDRNKIFSGDSVQASANYFDEHLFYIRSNNQNNSNFLDLSYAIREDHLPRNGEMQRNSLAKTLTLSTKKQLASNQNIQVAFIYRNVDFENYGSDVNTDEKTDNSLSGRFDWNGSFFKKIITNELTYTVSNSRELKKEYIFLQVPTGEGNYHWIDSNEDGIKDLNEFFLAIHFDEKNYIKVFIPTSEYIDAFESTFNYRFNLRFPLTWKKQGSFKRFLYRISNTTAWTSNSKTQDESIASRLLAFAKPIDENEILSLRENFRTTWFFNRANPRYGLNFGYKLNHFINLLTGGKEERKIDGFDVLGRLNLGQFYTIRIASNIQKEYSFSELLQGRDYIIQSKKIQPSFSWQPHGSIRFNVKYGYSNRENIQSLEEAENSLIHEVGGEIRWSKLKKTNFQGEVTIADVSFTGVENSPSGYSVLAGYKPGANMNFMISWQQTLFNGLQLSVNYNGRKSENTPMIHIGRVMVNALF